MATDVVLGTESVGVQPTDEGVIESIVGSTPCSAPLKSISSSLRSRLEEFTKPDDTKDGKWSEWSIELSSGCAGETPSVDGCTSGRSLEGEGDLGSSTPR